MMKKISNFASNMDTYIKFAKYMLQLVLAPTKGWEDISASQLSPILLAQRCMLPLFGIAALTVFIQLHYHEDVSISYYVIKAAVIFASYFVTYIMSPMVYANNLGKYIDGEPNAKKYTTVVVYGLSLLALSTIICNFLPTALGLTLLFTIGVTLILWKSSTYLFVKAEKNLRFAFFVFLSTVAIPFAIQALFDWLLNA